MFFILVVLSVFFIKTKAIQKIIVSSFKRSANNSTLEIIDTGNDLIPFKYKLITRPELDSLLRINHLSLDTMKAERSILLNIINTKTIVIVDRRRSEADKRVFEYYIS